MKRKLQKKKCRTRYIADNMCDTRGLFVPNGLGEDERPRRTLLPHEELFICEYSRYLLHKGLTAEGILSPYGSKYYPPTDTKKIVTEENMQRETNLTQISKECIASRSNIKEEKIALKGEKTTTEKDEWITVPHQSKSQTSTKKANQQNTYANQYEALGEEEVEKEERETIGLEEVQNVKVLKDDKKREEYEVEKMTVEEVERCINSTIVEDKEGYIEEEMSGELSI